MVVVVVEVVAASHLPFTKLGLAVGHLQPPAPSDILPPVQVVPVVVVVVAAAFSAAAAIAAWFAASVPSPYIVAATLRRSCQDMLSPKNLPSASPQLVLFCSASDSTPPCSNVFVPSALKIMLTVSPSLKVWSSAPTTSETEIDSNGPTFSILFPLLSKG